MLPHRRLLAAVLISSLLATGCKQVAKTLGELQTLQAALAKKFGDEVVVNVSETDKNLIVTVSFINSALNNKSVDERFKRATEAATVVTTNYARINNVGAIWVGFVRRTTRMLVFHYAEGLNFFPFDRTGQPLQPPPETAPGVRLEAVANYRSDINESDVGAYGIQLEGVPGKDGVTLLPHFNTSGDVNSQRGKPPKTVQFDFASYSSTPRFAENTQFTFIADGEEILKTKGTFHGNDAQFCYLQVPYPAFRKMIKAMSLAIKVGAKEYRLTPSQFGAVRKMGDYISE